MPRRPEIGNVQLYPNRPLKKSDRNGYVLKFYCPIRRKRIRRNCGTRDRREARRILRECRERLLNGQYVESGGAITATHALQSRAPIMGTPNDGNRPSTTWQDAYDRYRKHKSTRVRSKSLTDSVSRLNIAERIFEGYREDYGLSEGLLVTEVMTLDMLEYLQDRLLAGDECRYDVRSPNTVNSMMAAVMAFVRFCYRHCWIEMVPPVEKLDTDDVMKGRPISGEEFERLLEATSEVVGKLSAPSWQFALRALWESGFRVGDLMDFSWDDDRHIHPVWPSRKGIHPTIVIPSTQKNGRHQEIPMLPGLRELLESVPKQVRTGWVVNPLPIETVNQDDRFRPLDRDLINLVSLHTNSAIADACGVSEAAVRKWLVDSGIVRSFDSCRTGLISTKTIRAMKEAARAESVITLEERSERLTKEHVGRLISLIGEKAGVLVVQSDDEQSRKAKFASAHDLRRGCAQRLINKGVSAETLKVVLRHRSFSTTEKFYGATRSTQAAATELQERSAATQPHSFVGGLVGGHDNQPQLSTDEVAKLKSLLNSL